jgi:hypothetical protein
MILQDIGCTSRHKQGGGIFIISVVMWINIWQVKGQIPEKLHQQPLINIWVVPQGSTIMKHGRPR